MSTDFIAIGERIRGIREACDVTAEDMADRVGCFLQADGTAIN